MKKLILASGSPRRRELLAAAGYEFEIIVPSDKAECGVCSGETPNELVARMAWQKAVDVVPQVRKEAIIISCDTMAECNGQMIGKPNDREHAEQILRTMMGQTHHVYSGLCLWSIPENIKLIEVDATKLQMETVTDDELEAYLDTDQWEGKAGAFGYQDGLDWVKIVTGSPSNVVGLPMERFEKMLKQMAAK